MRNRSQRMAELGAALGDVRAQLADAGPITYNALIIAIDRAKATNDLAVLVSAASAVLELTRHVKGGAIEKLRRTVKL